MARASSRPPSSIETAPAPQSHRWRAGTGRPAVRGIRFYLTALIVLAVVPPFAIVGVLVARQNAIQTRTFQRSLLATSLALSVAVDRELGSYRMMLETLAQSDDLRRGDLASFHGLAARVAAQHQALFVSLFARDGRQVLHTLRAFGAELPTPFASRDPGADPATPPVGDASRSSACSRPASPWSRI